MTKIGFHVAYNWERCRMTPAEFKRLYQGTFLPPEREPLDPQDPDGTKRARRLEQWRRMRQDWPAEHLHDPEYK